MIWEFAVGTLISLFAIINPMGAVPNYAALTSGFTLSEKRLVIKKAALVAFIILVIFTIIGHLIFDFLHITVGSFRIAGGIVLIIIALEMVKGNTPQSRLNPKEKKENLERDQIGVVPLGIPLLAGPGSITTVMIAATDGEPNRIVSTMLIIVCTGFVLSFAYVILRNSDLIFKRIGRTGTKVVSRIMGLLLAAIAVQFVADGIKDLFPILA